jgi:hypothetical protein
MVRASARSRGVSGSTLSWPCRWVFREVSTAIMSIADISPSSARRRPEPASACHRSRSLPPSYSDSAEPSRSWPGSSSAPSPSVRGPVASPPSAASRGRPSSPSPSPSSVSRKGLRPSVSRTMAAKSSEDICSRRTACCSRGDKVWVCRCVVRMSIDVMRTSSGVRKDASRPVLARARVPLRTQRPCRLRREVATRHKHRACTPLRPGWRGIPGAWHPPRGRQLFAPPSRHGGRRFTGLPAFAASRAESHNSAGARRGSRTGPRHSDCRASRLFPFPKHRRFPCPPAVPPAAHPPRPAPTVLAELKEDHKRVKKAYRDFQKLDAEDDPEALREPGAPGAGRADRARRASRRSCSTRRRAAPSPTRAWSTRPRSSTSRCMR